MYPISLLKIVQFDHFRKKKRNPTVVLEDGSPVFNTMEFTEESIESVQIENDRNIRLKELIQERNTNGLFKSIADFNRRLSHSVLNKKQIEKLILSNSFKSIYPNKNILIANLEEILKKMESNSLFENDINDDHFLNSNKSIELDEIKSEFDSYGFLFSTRKQTDLLAKINNSSFGELTSNKVVFNNSFYFYVIKVLNQKLTGFWGWCSR